MKGKEKVMKRENLIKLTKYLLDFMFFGGIVVTVSLPVTLKVLGAFSEKLHERKSSSGSNEEYLEVVRFEDREQGRFH